MFQEIITFKFFTSIFNYEACPPSKIWKENKNKKWQVFWAEYTFLTNKISIYGPHFTEMLQKVTNCIEKLVDGTYREPQWQKSEDTEKKLLGSSKYLASNCP